ncbi:Appr-1-p processing protein [Sulfurimonas sp.]|uniref:Appr-1-p processing protein n=1 Tax=Sulfurimonas sp. TaxID=2022749 RepID=UPI002600FE28|nr:Appr-1-p processing protein [Sulfurimonas sp.]
MNLKIKFGDLLKEKGTFIVTPCNQEKVDVVIESSSTQTNYKYIFYVSANQSYMQMQASLNSMLIIIKDKVKSEDIQNPSLLMPLLGCGVGGLKKEKVFLLIKSIFQKADFDLDVIIYFDDKKDYYEFYSKKIKF